MSMTTPWRLQVTPSGEVAYRIRLRVPSFPEYHILYVAPSLITDGCLAMTPSADPGGPMSSTIPSRIHVALVRDRMRSPEDTTSTFDRCPPRKSPSDVWVHERAPTGWASRLPSPNAKTKHTINSRDRIPPHLTLV